MPWVIPKIDVPNEEKFNNGSKYPNIVGKQKVMDPNKLTHMKAGQSDLGDF